MATSIPELPEQERESFADDLSGMGNFFVDPSGAARHVFHKWFWIGPIVVSSIVSIVVGQMMLPLVQHVLDVTPPPSNANPDQYQRGVEIGMMIQRITVYFTPLLIIALTAIQALIIWGMSSILNVTAKFGSIFNLVAGCSLITALASIASMLVLKAKGEISTMAELRPPLGIDIFLPETTNKYLLALAGYFSVFQIWWIVMLVLIFSAAFRVRKGTAFTAIVPLVVLGVLARVVFAVFQR